MMRTTSSAFLYVVLLAVAFSLASGQSNIPSNVVSITFDQAPKGVSLTLDVVRDSTITNPTLSATNDGKADNSVFTINSGSTSSSVIVSVKAQNNGGKGGKGGKTTGKSTGHHGKSTGHHGKSTGHHDGKTTGHHDGKTTGHNHKATKKGGKHNHNGNGKQNASSSGVSHLAPTLIMLFGSIGLWFVKGTAKTSTVLFVSVLAIAFVCSSNTYAAGGGNQVVILVLSVPPNVDIQEITTYPDTIDLSNAGTVLNFVYTSSQPTISFTSSATPTAAATPTQTATASPSVTLSVAAP
jgi:hypothetical protein